MQRYFIFIVLNFLFSQQPFAQTAFEVSRDPKDSSVRVFKGCLTRADLAAEPTFTWLQSGMDAYQPSDKIIEALQQRDTTLQFVVFGGTWCDDTQFILPRFLKWLQQANFPDSGVTIFGVDRNKQSIGHLSNLFQITRVPTIIVFKEGREAGRVVEYGKTGVWDKELASFIP